MPVYDWLCYDFVLKTGVTKRSYFQTQEESLGNSSGSPGTLSLRLRRKPAALLLLGTQTTVVPLTLLFLEVPEMGMSRQMDSHDCWVCLHSIIRQLIQSLSLWHFYLTYCKKLNLLAF